MTLHPLPRLGTKRPVFDARIGSNSFGDLPDWNLDDLYTDPDAPELQRDLTWLETACAGFASTYQGKLAGLSAAQMLACVQAYEAIDITAGRIGSYAGLRYYQNTMDSERAKFMADVQDAITTFTTPLVFFSLEFNRLDEAALADLLASNADLARYRPVMDRMRAMRPYQLSDEMEQYLHDASVVGASAWNKLFDETMAGLMFKVAGEEEELNLEATLNLMTDTDRAKRARWLRCLISISSCSHGCTTPLPRKKRSRIAGARCQARSMAAICPTMSNPRWWKPCAMRLSPPTPSFRIAITS